MAVTIKVITTGDAVYSCSYMAVFCRNILPEDGAGLWNVGVWQSDYTVSLAGSCIVTFSVPLFIQVIDVFIATTESHKH
jgi:hypothetical protein